MFTGVFIIHSCVQNYCKDSFLNFLCGDGITIEIIKCSEGNFVSPRTILVASISGDSTHIAHFLQCNKFSVTDSLWFLDGKTESWEREEFENQYKPYSHEIGKSQNNYFYTNDSIGVSMIYVNHFLFIKHSAAWFQN